MPIPRSPSRITPSCLPAPSIVQSDDLFWSLFFAVSFKMFIILFALLFHRLKSQKTFQIINSEPDGLCFYTSFLKHLKLINHDDKDFTPLELKTKIYKKYKKKHGEPRILTVLHPRNNHWATDEIAQIVANIYGIDIFIREKMMDEWTWTHIESVKKKFQSCHLFFENNHFDYMQSV